MDEQDATAIAAKFVGGRIRKITIEVEIEADNEATLDAVERRMAAECQPATYVYRDIDTNIITYRLNSGAVRHGAPGE